MLAAITLPSNDAAADRGEEKFTKEFGLLRRVYRRLQSAYQARDELEDERRIDTVDRPTRVGIGIAGAGEFA